RISLLSVFFIIPPPPPPSTLFPYTTLFRSSRGTHLRVRCTPDVVICAPWTSLIWPAGQEPSSTITRWPSLRSTMSCSRDTIICRSEEHTSELQSRGHLVCRLLLEKKK